MAETRGAGTQEFARLSLQVQEAVQREQEAGALLEALQDPAGAMSEKSSSRGLHSRQGGANSRACATAHRSQSTSSGSEASLPSSRSSAKLSGRPCPSTSGHSARADGRRGPSVGDLRPQQEASADGCSTRELANSTRHSSRQGVAAAAASHSSSEAGRAQPSGEQTSQAPSRVASGRSSRTSRAGASDHRMQQHVELSDVARQLTIYREQLQVRSWRSEHTPATRFVSGTWKAYPPRHIV